MSGELQREMKRAENAASSDLQVLIEKHGLHLVRLAFARIERASDLTGRLKKS